MIIRNKKMEQRGGGQTNKESLDRRANFVNFSVS